MKIIIRTCLPERIEFMQELANKLQYPNVVFCIDEQKSARHTFLKALKIAGSEACVHMEDDIILTSDFYNKLMAAIELHSHSVIQFFSMRKDDIRIGSRWDYGRNFMMNQCHYFPEGYSRMILEHFPNWGDSNKHVSGNDLLVADFLKSRKEKYWIHVPSLVQHRQTVSLINPRRSQFRHSLTFEV